MFSVYDTTRPGHGISVACKCRWHLFYSYAIDVSISGLTTFAPSVRDAADFVEEACTIMEQCGTSHQPS